MSDLTATLAAFDRALAELRRLIAELHTLRPPTRPMPAQVPPPDGR